MRRCLGTDRPDFRATRWRGHGSQVEDRRRVLAITVRGDPVEVCPAHREVDALAAGVAVGNNCIHS